MDVVGLHRGKFPAVLCPLPLQTGLQVLYALLAGGYLVLKTAVVRLQFLDFSTAQKRTHLCYDGGLCLHLDRLQLSRVDFLSGRFQPFLRLFLLSLELSHVRFQFTRLPPQIAVILGGGDMSGFRTSYPALQAVFHHDLGIVVVVGKQSGAVQHVVGTQSGGIRLFAVGSSSLLRLLLSRLPALSRHYRYKCGVYVRRVLVHVQHRRDHVLPPEGPVQPVHAVPAPVVQPSGFLYFHHVLMCS